MLEIVTSDQLVVNDIISHVLNVIRHVLIKISTNRSGPFEDSPKGPVSFTKSHVLTPSGNINM